MSASTVPGRLAERLRELLALLSADDPRRARIEAQAERFERAHQALTRLRRRRA